MRYEMRSASLYRYAMRSGSHKQDKPRLYNGVR